MVVVAVVVVLLLLVEVDEVENALLVIIDVGESWKNGEEVKDGYNVIIVETFLFFVVVIVDTGNELKLVKVFKNLVGRRSKFRLCCIILRFLFSDNNNSSNNNNNNSRNRRNNNDKNRCDKDNNKNDKINIVVIFRVQPVLVMYK